MQRILPLYIQSLSWSEFPRKPSLRQKLACRYLVWEGILRRRSEGTGDKNGGGEETLGWMHFSLKRKLIADHSHWRSVLETTPPAENLMQRASEGVTPSKVLSRATCEVHGILRGAAHCNCGWNKRSGREDVEEVHKRSPIQTQPYQRAKFILSDSYSVHTQQEEFQMPG